MTLAGFMDESILDIALKEHQQISDDYNLVI